MRILPLLLTLILLAANAYAQDRQPAAVTQACKSVENITVPKPDSPVENCSAARLYYIDGKPAYAAVSSNALLTDWLHKDYERSPSFASAGTLIMIYANGDGVPRNVDLALRIACIEDQGDPDYSDDPDWVSASAQVRSGASKVRLLRLC